MTDYPDYTKVVAVTVEVTPPTIGPVNVAEYDSTPEDLADGERGPLLTDIKGRPYVILATGAPPADVPNPKKYEGTVVTAGTPVTLPVNTDLGRNAGDGYIINDGPGKILLDISKDGTTYETDITMKVNEVLLLKGLNIHTIRVDADTNSTAYRSLII